MKESTPHRRKQWKHLKVIYKMKKVYLYGASGHAKVIIDALCASGYKVNGLFDDNLELTQLLDYPVLGAFNESRLGSSELIISIGINSIRKRLVESLPTKVSFATAIHPSSIISPQASILYGTVVMQGAIIQSDSKIGKHCIINTGSTIDHDCLIDDYVHISPNATLCGNVSVGQGSQIGAGAVVIPGIKIGKWSIIGAGSVVIKDIPDNVVVAGNPARIIKRV